MHKETYEKTLFHFSLIGIAASILVGFYDVIFGSLLELGHLILEIIEMGLDRLVVYVLGTDLQTTQMIVFYILLILGGLFIYLLWKSLVPLAQQLTATLKQDCIDFWKALSEDWEALPILSRFLWISGFLLANYLVSFLFF